MRATLFLTTYLPYILTHLSKPCPKFVRRLTNSTQALKDSTDLCQPRQITPALWKDLGMNQYLNDYPSGEILTLQDFAEQVGASNFDCGIGSFCDPSDLCAPVEGKAWYALVAARTWNIINNALYSAIPVAVSIAADVTPSMVMDLIPDSSPFWTQSACLTDLTIAIMCAIPGSVFGSGTMGTAWTVLLGLLTINSGWSWTESNVLVSDPPKYEIWEDIVFSLDKFQKQMQLNIVDSITSVIESGISTQKGLSGINSDGHLFIDLSVKTVDQIRSGLLHDLRLRALSLIFKYQKAFIVRGAEPCVRDGPEGSLEDQDTLSMCDKDNIMMTIAIPKAQKADTKIYNAKLLENKYEIVTEDIIASAWACQTKYGIYEHKFIFDLADADSPRHTECMFNMAVCDLTRPDIHRLWVKTGNIVKACRELGKLPI